MKILTASATGKVCTPNGKDKSRKIFINNLLPILNHLTFFSSMKVTKIISSGRVCD
jgi:hypothetical protein